MFTSRLLSTAHVSQQAAAYGPASARNCVHAAGNAHLRDDDFLRTLVLLHAHTSHYFSQYKESTLLRGIHDRMIQTGMNSTHVYRCYLEQHPEEVQLLFRKLLIPVTRFFRDPMAFATLKRYVLAQLPCCKPQPSVFRAWVPACATGEEAYSLAMLLHEVMRKAPQVHDFHIFATDIDKEAVAAARRGSYPARIVQDVPARRLEHFFRKTQDGYQVNCAVRAKIVFSVQNVARHLPTSRLDLISCRNLMIYLEAGLQESLMIAFHRALRPGGLLFLSPSESIGNATDLFTPVSRKWRLYRANSLDAALNSSHPEQSQGSGPALGGWPYEA
jgi:two-component system CheB/CheR fusion protein